MNSLDLLFSCLGLRESLVIDDFLGRLVFIARGKGGKVDDLPGGEREIEDGNSSLVVGGELCRY